MGLEIMFADHQVRKQAFLDYKNIDFKQWPYWDFFESDFSFFHDFGQPLQNSSLIVLEYNGNWSSVWWLSS